MRTFEFILQNLYHLISNIIIKFKFLWYRFIVIAPRGETIPEIKNEYTQVINLGQSTDLGQTITREKILSEWKPHDYWAVNGVSFVGIHDDNPTLPDDPAIHTENAIQVENDHLYLKNIKEPYTYKASEDNVIEFPIQSGKILYNKPFHFGYFEIVCKIPRTGSAWPAFWLSGAESWPPEIDIFEFWTSDKPDKQVISLHHGNDSQRRKTSVLGKQRDTVNRKLVGKSFDLDDFNKFACHWQPNKIDFYTNDVLVYSYQPSAYIMQFFNQPMFLIVNNMVYNRDGNNVYEADYPNSLIVNSIKGFTKY
jgi:beta-glucanase (GH16 family)